MFNKWKKDTVPYNLAGWLTEEQGLNNNNNIDNNNPSQALCPTTWLCLILIFDYNSLYYVLCVFWIKLFIFIFKAPSPTTWRGGWRRTRTPWTTQWWTSSRKAPQSWCSLSSQTMRGSPEATTPPPPRVGFLILLFKIIRIFIKFVNFIIFTLLEIILESYRNIFKCKCYSSPLLFCLLSLFWLMFIIFHLQKFTR